MYDEAMNENAPIPIRKNNPFSACLIIYLRTIFFKASPDELPAHALCIVKSLLLYVGVYIFLLDLQSSFVEILLKVLLEFGLLLGIIVLGLKITDHQERLTQTLSAVVGVNLLISLIGSLIYYIINPDVLSGQTEPTQGMVNASIILLIWNLSVISHIFKRSFEISTLMASILAFNYFILFEVLIITFLSPA